MANYVDEIFLIKFFKVDKKTLKEWKKIGMPYEKNGFDFVKVTDWRIRYLEGQLKEAKFISRREVADLLERNEHYINQLELKENLPKESFNKYDVFKIFSWHTKRLKILHDKEINKLNEKYSEKKNRSAFIDINLRLKRAQAERIEMENAENVKKLIPKVFYLESLEFVFTNIRNKLLGYPNKIAYQVFGAKDLTDAKIKTKKIINEVLTELSDPKHLFENRKNGKDK